MRISDWSSDVCSSDLVTFLARGDFHELLGRFALLKDEAHVFHVAGEIAPDAPPHPFEGTVDSAPPATRPIDMEWGGMRRFDDMRRDQFRKIGRANVRHPVTNPHLVSRLLLEKK